MRQNLVPRISFHAKFEVTIPDVGGNAVLHFASRHVIVEFRATRHCVAHHGEKLAGSFEDFGNRINESLVVARLMSDDRWNNRRYDVLRATMPGQEDFDACAGRLRRFDKNEFVFMGQNHRLTLETPRKLSELFSAACRKLECQQAGCELDDVFPRLARLNHAR